jgi:hypothetical protein
MARRIASLLAPGPSLDGNHATVKAYGLEINLAQ